MLEVSPQAGSGKVRLEPLESMEANRLMDAGMHDALQ
jgi:hypothetical protein